jgi:hypothetical protein
MAVHCRGHCGHFASTCCAGKLKDLGNTILGKFGMSTNDFECVKDPNTGSFSIGMKKK